MRLKPWSALAALTMALAAPAAGSAYADGSGRDDKPAAAPALSIAITDGVRKADKGDRLTYRISVRNQGSRKVKSLRLEQVLPATDGKAAASHGGKVKDGKVVWTSGLKKGGAAEVTSEAVLARMNKNQLRAASTVCAYVNKASSPSVCASDLDLLPGGATARTEAADETSSTGVGLAVTGGASLLLGAGAVVVVRKRRRRAKG